MYVELLDGRNEGKIRDLDNGTALDLIKLGRAKRAFGEPTDAAPVLAGGYRGTANAPAKQPCHVEVDMLASPETAKKKRK
jgi:hypothetical protein